MAAEDAGEGRQAVRRIDWSLVEADFLATGLSYARLAEKHGISVDSVKRKAAAEHWQAKLRELTEREEALKDAAEAEQAEPMELALETRRSRRMQLQDIADRMLEKVSRSLDELEPDKPFALAALVRALKDLRELQGLRKDALDLAEQQARIERLRLAAQRTGTENGGEEPGGVLILPAIEARPEDG